MASKATTRSVEAFETLEKIRIGMIGFFDIFHCRARKSPKVRIPKTMRRITVGELHGSLTPAIWIPRRNMTVAEATVTDPITSISLRPVMRFVRGSCTSRKSHKRIIATRIAGTTDRE